ncbi:MAG: T9SS type A sorting domain-containing protein, partial [Candidatus Kariarchaeaceae archaeon]
QLTSLNILNSSSLHELRCGYNQLDILDLSNLPNLSIVWCNDNRLTELILLNDTSLCGLDCSNNLLTSLDLSTNFKLCSCRYGDAPVTICDLSGMPSLYEVCEWESISYDIYTEFETTGSPNVYFTSDCTTGLNEYVQRDLSIYPNPLSNLLTIEIKFQGPHIIELYSLSGQLVYTRRTNEPIHQIDLSSFEKGLYIITIRSRDFMWTEKIIKQ